MLVADPRQRRPSQEARDERADETVAAKPTAAFDANMGPVRHRPRLLHPAGLPGRLKPRTTDVRKATDSGQGDRHEKCRGHAATNPYRSSLPGRWLSGLAVATASPDASAKPQRDGRGTTGSYPVVYHRTKSVDGIKIFYREAGPDRCTGGAAAARLSDLLAHVPQPDPGSGGPLSRDRARLSRLRPERHARPRASFAYTFDRFGELVDGLLGQLGVTPLRDVRHGLRRPGRLAAGAQASRARQRPHRPERQRL